MYSIEFMNDSEFERLPYRNMGDKIGVCDRNRAKVYVRKSGSKTMDALTTIHEIEHMEEGDWGKHANHQDKEMAGVYYKGFGDVINQLTSFIPGIGPLISGGMSATNNLGMGAQKPKAPDSTNYGGGNVMQSFKPQQPQASVINPGGAGGQTGSGSSGSMPGIGQDLIQKIRGQFGGQTPQQGMSFGSGNTPFGGV